METFEHSTVSCRCGSVKLTLLERRPRLVIECACCDCCQKVDWSRASGGAFQAEPRVPTLVYFGNAIMGSEGAERLQLNMLRDNGTSQFVSSTCCSSILAVEHPFYEGNLIMVLADACNVRTESTLVPVARNQVKDWERYRSREAFPPWTGPANAMLYRDERDDPEALPRFRARYDKSPPEQVPGAEPLRALLSRVGISSTPVVLGLVEGAPVYAQAEEGVGAQLGGLSLSASTVAA